MSISLRNFAEISKGRDDGFTLVEILVAITILMVGLLGVAQMQVAAIRGNDLSGSSTVALNLAQQHLEGIINADFNDLVDANPGNNGDLLSTTNVDYQDVDVQGNAVDLGKYTLIWNVADNTPIQDTMTVVVMVTWKNGLHRRTLTHIKSLAS